MADSAYRQILMLKRIPVEPRKVSAKGLVDYLRLQEGYDITERTVQRDLIALSTSFGLKCDDRSKPYGWSFSKGSVLDIPLMDSMTALTFDMVGRYLRDMLPASVMQYLTPHINQARERLDDLKPRLGGKWSSKFVTLPEGFQLKPATIPPNVIEQVYQAVLENRCLEIDRGDGNELVHPLGIVHRGRVIYLIATFFRYEDVRQISLQRINKATISDQKMRKPRNFSLKSYIDGGGFDYKDRANKSIKIKLRFYGEAGNNLHDTPLSDDQKIITVDDDLDIKIVSATVSDTWELRWWVLGFGSQVEVISPKILRDEFASQVKELSEMYLKK